MTVYIEYVIADNFVIDIVLLYATVRLVRIKYSRLGIFAAALLGTAFAVVSPFIKINAIVLFLLKASVGAIMVLTCGKYNSVKRFLLSCTIFYSLTFATGGLILAVNFMLGYDVRLNQDGYELFGKQDFPVFVIVLPVALAVKLFSFIFSLAKKRGDDSTFERQVAIFDGQQCVKITGFIDTGNTLYDNRTGKPVSILSKSLAKRYILSGVINMKKEHYLQCSTIHGCEKILVFQIDRLVIYYGDSRNIIDNAMLGISPTDLNGQAEIILHPGLLGE